MRRSHWKLVAMAAILLFSSRVWAGSPPAQKLPSALLVFPLISATGEDTRVELVNLTGNFQELECFYIDGGACGEIGFGVTLTPYQPLAWFATQGLNDPTTGTSVPGFFGTGELKCAVVPPSSQTGVAFYNTIQGRATIFNSVGQTVSYGAVGFQRLSDGDFTGVLTLDGTTYAQCPDKLHFDVLTDQPTTSSQMVLVPCTENLLLQVPTSVTVQFVVTNEFEQPFSSSIRFSCFEEISLASISTALTRAVAGSDTAHVMVRSIGSPVLGLVIDTLSFQGHTDTAGNEPSFDGGRSATVTFP